MNIPSWAVTVGLVVIVFFGAAWICNRGNGLIEHEDADDAKGGR